MRELRVLRYYKGAGLHRQISPRPDLKWNKEKDKYLISLLHGFGRITLYSQRGNKNKMRE